MVAFVWSHSPLRGRRLRPVRHFEGVSPGWRNRKIGIFWVIMLQTGDGVASVLVPDSFASSSIIGLTDSSVRIVGERVAESLGGGQPGAFSLARSVSALTFFCWGTRRADSVAHRPIGRLVVSGQLANGALKGLLGVEGPFGSYISADAIEGLPRCSARASGRVGERPG